jgi:hypothetical protein
MAQPFIVRLCVFPILILGVPANPLRAQAMIGYGAVSGQSAVASGPAATGKAAAGILGKLNQMLAEAAKPGDAAKPAPPAPSVTTAAKPPAASTEPSPAADFSALAIGMDRADLLKNVGKPSMTISSVESSVLVENCSYRKGAGMVAVTLRDGKVTAITGAGELSAK